MPEPPVIVSPEDRSEVTSIETDMVIVNSVDLEGDALSYSFEIDRVNTFDSADLLVSEPVFEGSGTTLWHVSEPIYDTCYYWRAKSSDGLSESAWVSSLTPKLELHASVDPDHDALTYGFKLYANPALTSLIIGPENTVNANIYAPRGTPHIHSNTHAQGAFFGKDVKIEYDVEIGMDNGF